MTIINEEILKQESDFRTLLSELYFRIIDVMKFF